MRCGKSRCQPDLIPRGSRAAAITRPAPLLVVVLGALVLALTVVARWTDLVDASIACLAACIQSPWLLYYAAAAGAVLCLGVCARPALIGLYADMLTEECFGKYCLPQSEFVPTSGGLVHIIRWRSASMSDFRDSSMLADVNIVCLHGCFDNAFSFEAWAAEMIAQVGESATVQVVSVDLPGHGLTGPWEFSGPTRQYSRTADVSFLREVLTKLGLTIASTNVGEDSNHYVSHGTATSPKIFLAGHSVGGAVCLAYASWYPEDVHGLIVAAPWGLDYDAHTPFREHCFGLVSLGLSPWVYPVVDRAFTVMRYLTPNAAFHLVALTAWSSTGGTVEERAGRRRFANRTHAMLLREGNRSAVAARVAELAAEERDHQLSRSLALAQLGAVRCPVQVQWGGEDMWLPVTRAKSFAQALSAAANVDVRIWDGVGHCVTEQFPWLSAQAACELIHRGLR